ncbi:MAG: FkbM family methyltransferase [Lentilitoribacter sp.]
MNKLKLYAILEVLFSRKMLWKLGRFLYLGARRDLQNDPLTNGEYELFAWYLDGILTDGSKSSKIFLDVGANFAHWSVELVTQLNARNLAAGTAVHAFEPGPTQFEIAEKNLNKYAKDIGQLHKLAIGQETGKVQFNLTGEESGSSAIATGSRSAIGELIEVDLDTLESFCSRHGIDQIDIIKVDTEGNDFNVIAGCKNLLANGNISILQFEYNWRWIDFGYFLSDVFKAIEQMPYKLGKLTPQGIEIYSHWAMELDRFIECNFVLIHEDIVPKLPTKSYVFDRDNVAVEAVS